MTEVMETVDADVVQPITKKEAAQIDRSIRSTVKKIQGAWERIEDGWDQLKDLVAQAKDGFAYVPLGYESWTSYVADVVQIHPRTIEERQELVSLLAGEGMSGRAIASVAGVHRATVQRDISGGSSAPPETTGLDGKTYKKPQPKSDEPNADEPQEDSVEPEQRVSLLVEFREAIDNTGIDLNVLSILVDDDRFDKQRTGIAKRHLNTLQELAYDLEKVIDALMAT